RDGGNAPGGGRRTKRIAERRRVGGAGRWPHLSTEFLQRVRNHVRPACARGYWAQRLVYGRQHFQNILLRNFCWPGRGAALTYSLAPRPPHIASAAAPLAARGQRCPCGHERRSPRDG